MDLEINPKTIVEDENDPWFTLDYGIKSINLAYALLILRLGFGATIQIVTLPPDEKNYPKNAHLHKNLLDFLDEIGCEIYLNENLHSKLILSNDSALIGSFNLSKSALYDRQEIGISLDDIGNLKTLDKHVGGIMDSSIPYGYTIDSRYTDNREYNRAPGYESDPLPQKITRGVLYDEILYCYYGNTNYKQQYNEFLKDFIGLETYYYKYLIYEVAKDLSGFYLRALMTLLKSENDMDDNIREEQLQRFSTEFKSGNLRDIGKLLNCVETRLIRKHIPNIKLRLKAMPRSEQESDPPKWAQDL